MTGGGESLDEQEACGSRNVLGQEEMGNKVNESPVYAAIIYQEAPVPAIAECPKGDREMGHSTKCDLPETVGFSKNDDRIIEPGPG
jgi:hypothetical protein